MNDECSLFTIYSEKSILFNKKNLFLNLQVFKQTKNIGLNMIRIITK